MDRDMIHEPESESSVVEAEPPAVNKPAVGKANPVVEEKPAVVVAKPAAEAKPVVEAKPPVVKAKPAVVEEKPPGVETKPPVVESKPPAVEAKPPAVEAKPPVVEAKPPVVETKHHVVNKPAVVEAKPPAVDAKLPVVEAKPPVVDAKLPVVEAKPPVVEAKPPVVDAKLPVVEAKPPVVGAKLPVVEAKLPVVVAKPPVVESEPAVVVAKLPVVESKPSEDSDRKASAKLAEDHADADKKSTRKSKKKQKPFFIAIVVAMLIGGIVVGLQLDQKDVLKKVQTSLKQAEASVSNSEIAQDIHSGFGQLTQAVRSVAGWQAPTDSKEATHTTHQSPLAKDEALNDEEASQTTYEVSKPLVKDLTMNDEYVCQIRAIQHIEIRSLEKGYLQNVLVDEGQAVSQGQLLFQIKPSVYEADVQKSEAELELSKIELENNQALVDKDIISASEAAMSAAKLAKVKAELELAKTHLGFTEIRAPFDGLIGRFGDIRLGSLLEENELLTTLSDTHRLWVYFNVPEAQYLDYMKKKRLPQRVQLELANKEIYPETGTIEAIQSDFNSASGNIAFRASFSNPHGLLRYGQTGKILWPKKIKHAVILPQKSTFEILDKRFIFVVDKTGVIHEREIKVLREAPNVYIVDSGIAPDEMYLLERQNKLDKGDKIRYQLINPQRAIENLKLYAE